MKTQIFWFISPPADPSWLTEAHPFGSSVIGYHTDLGIHIDPDHVEDVAVVAVATGLVRIIPDPIVQDKGTLVLTLDARDLQNLSPILGGSPVFFVYRNVESRSIADSLEGKMLRYIESLKRENSKRDPQEEKLPVPTLEGLKGDFVQGAFWGDVTAGDLLGHVSPSTIPGAPGLLGFEIAYTPPLYDESGYQRLIELIQVDNLTTRRLDPVVFYRRLIQGISPDAEIHPVDGDNPLSNMLSQRILLELRDEFNRPIEGEVRLIRNGLPQTVDLANADRGTIELSPDGTYVVEIDNHVLTELPSGNDALSTPTRTLTAPEHWMMQSVFMANLGSNESWFAPNSSPLPLFTPGNRITPLIDGIATYKEMVKVLRKVRGSSDNHYIFLTAWWLTVDFQMVQGDLNSTFEKLVQEIADSGGKTYALVWKQGNFPQKVIVHPDLPPIDVRLPPSQSDNTAAVDRMNQIRRGGVQMAFAILDPAFEVAAHHQKMLIASAGNDLAVAFCGGIDINPNRLDTPFHSVSYPYHDVHAKVEGPAVADLNETFVDRWNANQLVHPNGNLPRIPDTASPNPGAVGTQFVQVTRTYPPTGNYPFAPNGELGTLLTLRRAIQRAQRFIYFEDQYVHPYPEINADGSHDSVGILTDLLEALKRIEYLLVVLPDNQTFYTQRKYRYRFLRVLLDEAQKTEINAKVLVFYARRPVFTTQPSTIADDLIQSLIDILTESVDDPAALGLIKEVNEEAIFVHSKIWLIDDVYAKIGSANVNRRSLTYDSEVDLHIIDGALTNGARTFARDFRMQLWAEWLQMQRSQDLLEDPTYALGFWESLSNEAFVRPYDPAARGGSHKILSREQGLWRTVIDPEGRQQP